MSDIRQTHITARQKAESKASQPSRSRKTPSPVSIHSTLLFLPAPLPQNTALLHRSERVILDGHSGTSPSSQLSIFLHRFEETNLQRMFTIVHAQLIKIALGQLGRRSCLAKRGCGGMENDYIRDFSIPF